MKIKGEHSMKILGKSGEPEDFKKSEIYTALEKAFQASGNVVVDEVIEELTDSVVTKLQATKSTPIDPAIITSIIEEVLRTSGNTEVFMQYRKQQQLKNALQTSSGLTSIFTKYLDKSAWEINENANMGYSLQGLNHAIVRSAIEKQWLTKIYPEKIASAYKEGYIHIHDLDSLSTYCCGWDLPDLLLQGFGGVPGKVTSGPPKHLGAALGQLVNFLYTSQGEIAGAVAISSLDTYMAPFIAKDKLTYNEVRQCVQEFVYNMNVPTRVGWQSPFSNVTLDLTVPEHMASQPAIIGGAYQKECLGEFQKEMDMFNKAFFEVMSQGDYQGKIFTFPIPTLNITKNFDWNNPNHKIIWDTTAKFGTPYFANYINSDMSPEESRSMCFTGNTPVLWRNKGKRGYNDLKSLYARYKNDKIEILMDGKFVTATPIKVNYNQPFVKITLANGKSYTVTNNHIHKTMFGDKKTTDLIIGDELCFSKNGITWDGVGGYDFGKFLGLYLAEGSNLNGDIQFSLSNEEYDVANWILEYASTYLGKNGSIQNNIGESISVFIHGKGVKDIVSSYISGKAKEKRLNSWWKLSTTALQGLWDGWMLGDGKFNGTEAYTSSKVLADQMCEVANILGIAVNIRQTDRVTQFGTKTYDSTIYTVHVCKTDGSGRMYSTTDAHLWCKITEISKVGNANKVAFCVEVLDAGPYFELPNGLITHNCCRLRLNLKEIHKRHGGLFGSGALTGSIGVVTLNLPMLAMEANGSRAKFYTAIEKYTDLAKESLELKRVVIEALTTQGLYPYAKHYLEKTYARDKKYWANHFSTIGLIGMYEAADILGIDYASAEGKKFGETVLKFMNRKLVKFQAETGNFYNLEATPAEGASYKLALAAKKKYPNIKTSGGAVPFFTNSTMLPVDYSTDLFKVLEHQDTLQSLYSGGCVLHAYLGEKLTGDQAKMLVRKVLTNYKLPYLSITPTFSICPTHGYIPGEHTVCPTCLAEQEQLKVKIEKLKGELHAATRS